MADLAILKANLDALTTARNSGVLKTRFGDREVTYKSDAEIRVVIAVLENEIAALEGSPVARTVNIRSRGWS